MRSIENTSLFHHGRGGIKWIKRTIYEQKEKRKTDFWRHLSAPVPSQVKEFPFENRPLSQEPNEGKKTPSEILLRYSLQVFNEFTQRPGSSLSLQTSPSSPLPAIRFCDLVSASNRSAFEPLFNESKALLRR